ncbi:MAG: GDP-mannose 4,6-dehydratase [Bacteroidales bacterium]|nr:GDP-mannose 4,6-dehydratase [Bacteroidales bacterium]
MKKILITGGAGFIGSHVVRLMVNKYPDYKIINLDALTYAGNLENLKDVEHKSNYEFVKGDITDPKVVGRLFGTNQFDGIIHLAAESHVDRSISNPMEFIHTNIVGTVTLLNAAREQWKNNMEGKRFYHISTDEVYGSLGQTGLFTETTAYDPRSPYSASKASSDHLVRVGGINEWKNIDLIKLLCQVMDEQLDRPKGDAEKLITFVKDRAGHDQRYAIDSSKLMAELNWKPSLQFEEGLVKTVKWYLENLDWMKRVMSGQYESYYNDQYGDR